MIGMDKLITTSSNQILVSNSGVDILAAISHTNCIIATVTRTISEECGGTGDGTKRVLLMVAAGLRQARSDGCIADLHSTLSLLDWQCLEPLQRVASLHLTRACQLPAKSDVHCSVLESATCQILEASLHTMFHNKVGIGAVRHLSKVVTELVMSHLQLGSRTGPEIRRVLEQLCSSPPLVTVAGASVTASRVVPGIVLRQGFSSKHTVLVPGTRVQFVALLCSLDAGKVQGASSAAVLVSSPLEYREAMARRESSLREGLEVLRQRGVQLLLCSERVSELAAFLCLDMGIALVHSLEESEVQDVCRAAGIRPATSNVMQALQEVDIGHAAGVVPILISARPSLLLQLSGTHKAFSLLVHGPSEGLVRQYSRLVGRGLSLVLQLLGPCSQQITFSPAGAAWEATMGVLLSQLMEAVRTHAPPPNAGSGLRAPYLAAIKIPASAVLPALAVLQAMADAVPNALAGHAIGSRRDDPLGPNRALSESASDSVHATAKRSTLHLVHNLREAHKSILSDGSHQSTLGLLVLDAAHQPTGGLSLDIHKDVTEQGPPPHSQTSTPHPAPPTSSPQGCSQEHQNDKNLPNSSGPCLSSRHLQDTSHIRSSATCPTPQSSEHRCQGKGLNSGNNCLTNLSTGHRDIPEKQAWMAMTIADCVSHGLIEPASLAPQLWQLALSLVIQVLRIDGVHAAGNRRSGNEGGLAQLNRGKACGSGLRMGGGGRYRSVRQSRQDSSGDSSEGGGSSGSSTE